MTKVGWDVHTNFQLSNFGGAVEVRKTLQIAKLHVVVLPKFCL